MWEIDIVCDLAPVEFRQAFLWQYASYMQFELTARWLGLNFSLEKALWHIFKLVFSELQRAFTVWVWSSSLCTMALKQRRLQCLLTWNIVHNFNIQLVTDILYICSQVRLKDCKFSDICNFRYCIVFMCLSDFDIALWNVKIHAALNWTFCAVALYLKFCHLVFRFQWSHW
jgi:hypothetical protein